MTNKSQNYRIIAATLNSRHIKYLYVLFPLYSKCIPILMHAGSYIESSKVRTPSIAFWERNNDK